MMSDVEVIPARPWAGWLLPCLALLVGCSEQDMVTQPKYKTYQESSFFADGMSARPLVAGTVARGQLRTDTAYYQGKSGEALVDTIPIRVLDPKAKADTPQDREERRKILGRGRERYDIYCSPCHGRTGDGRGMIVLRGLSPPPSYHDPRLRDAPAGHFYNVITNGYGAMYPYGSRIPPDDRWAIVAYIRALQLSQDAKLDDVPAQERSKLEASAR
ncbi:MAG: c-type cytochrome [Planctomycetaceae bacterium]